MICSKTSRIYSKTSRICNETGKITYIKKDENLNFELDCDGLHSIIKRTKLNMQSAEKLVVKQCMYLTIESAVFFSL
jgi:hypothetical protein